MDGKVYIVGAGPGDKRLITLKGVNYLKDSDIIIYDALVNPRLLQFARPDAKKISTEKLGRLHSRNYLTRQNRINQLMVKNAREGKRVCRLKSGDPYLFGRAAEETAYLSAHHINFEVVPGVTAAMGAAAAYNIPLTSRKLASTVCFVTGNEDLTKKDTMVDFNSLVKIGTLVFYMGIRNLKVITERLITAGKSPKIPAALIQNATFSNERAVFGSLSNIICLAERDKIVPPALLIVGEVVAQRKNVSAATRKPLSGKRILVTRARHQAGEFAQILENLGAEVEECPVIEIKPIEYVKIKEMIKKIKDYHWLILTSVNGVDIFMQGIDDIRQLGKVKIAAIGKMTAKRLREYKLKADIIPEEFCAEALAEKFKNKNLKGKKILLARAKDARDLLPRKLQLQGASVSEVCIYETKPVRGKTAWLRQKLKDQAIDCITFTSSSCARNFSTLFNRRLRKRLLPGVDIAAIGPVTKNTLAKLGVKTRIMPQCYTTHDLAMAIVKYYNGRDSVIKIT
ncbi:MAG: uroporphyrinogen-III C-methyltransferase [Candidatus Omnitrophota bacterium]